ncbi:MAG: hypothetical protein B7X00_01565 [Legionella sp. 21-45-4]|nr:MAG: hypothetical protein B7X00_01565 [Legionella sp. 21-45-4]
MFTIQPVHFDYFNKLHPHPEVSVLLGGSYISNAINRQTLQLLPYEVGEFADRFTNQSDAGAFTWGVDAKYRFNLHSPLRQEYAFDSFGAGLAVYQITNFNQTGEVQQFNLFAFDNYTYTLNLQTTRILANFDLNFHPLYNHFIPFMEGGFGGASTVMSYTSKPIDPVASPTFNLPNQTSWRFAYQVGTGIKYRPKNNLECSIHYLYANMGTANSSIRGNSSTLATPLKANMSAQNFLLGLTYLMK